MKSNTTDAETANSAFSWYDDGWDLGPNGSGNTYVGWSWRASDSSPVSNTDGTITSQVSANTTAGFSVVTYTGNGTAGATVGHGLGASLGMLITKPRSISGSWAVASTGLGTTGDTLGGFPESYYITLNNADGKSNNGSSVLALGDATKFAIGSGLEMNQSGATYVAYCWSDVEGYSKFGSYTGNGSADGPFVYTGFRPAWIMIKRTDWTNNLGWAIFDNKRDIDNLVELDLLANSSNAESTVVGLDFLSNGFKLKSNDVTWNTSSGTYIYMAFAENPFKNSLAR